jgi:hypothetical protein
LLPRHARLIPRLTEFVTLFEAQPILFLRRNSNISTKTLNGT